MAFELALITANWKTFVGCIGVGGLYIAQAANVSSEGQQWTLTGGAIAALCFLFRYHLAREKKHEEELKKLYERLLRQRGYRDEDDDGDPPPTRKTRP